MDFLSGFAAGAGSLHGMLTAAKVPNLIAFFPTHYYSVGHRIWCDYQFNIQALLEWRTNMVTLGSSCRTIYWPFVSVQLALKVNCIGVTMLTWELEFGGGK